MVVNGVADVLVMPVHLKNSIPKIINASEEYHTISTLSFGLPGSQGF
jgi:hypothetical protein